MPKLDWPSKPMWWPRTYRCLIDSSCGRNSNASGNPWTSLARLPLIENGASPRPWETFVLRRLYQRRLLPQPLLRLGAITTPVT